MERQRILQAIYPLLAPLPVPFAEHLVVRFTRTKRASSTTAWDMLVREIELKRDVAYSYMNTFVLTNGFSTGWLLDTLSALSPDKKPVPATTLSNWHGRKLLRYQSFGLPDIDSAAALYIARMIDSGERNWLPSDMLETEPSWWCWRQDSLESPRVPCPIPLPASLEPETLLWTPWAGGAWKPEWLPVGDGLGAIRFYGVRHIGQHMQWNLSYRALQKWAPAVLSHTDPDFFSRMTGTYNQKVEEMGRQMIHTLATEVLQSLALSRFEVFSAYVTRNTENSDKGAYNTNDNTLFS